MDAQTLATSVMVFVAIAIFWRRFQQTFLTSSASGCGSCTGCSGGNSAAAIKVTPLVQLGMSSSEKHAKKP
jgi:hypothetical protein